MCIRDRFIYDPKQEFENYVNSSSVVWQTPETDYWKNYLRNLINEHSQETQSEIAKTIIENFNNEVQNFKQVCPVYGCPGFFRFQKVFIVQYATCQYH